MNRRSPATPVGSGADEAPTISRASRLAQQRAERQARIEQPLQAARALVLSVFGNVHTHSADGRRARKLAERRANCHRRLSRLSASVIVGFVVFGSTAAFGFWSVTGSGAGTATAGELSVTAVAGSPQTPLVPGGVVDINLSVGNPSSSSVTLQTVTGANPTSFTGGTSGCTLANSGVTFVGTFSPNISIPAHSPGVAVALSGAAHMNLASDTRCQGATFTFPLSLTVKTP